MLRLRPSRKFTRVRTAIAVKVLTCVRNDRAHMINVHTSLTKWQYVYNNKQRPARCGTLCLRLEIVSRCDVVMIAGATMPCKRMLIPCVRIARVCLLFRLTGTR